MKIKLFCNAGMSTSMLVSKMKAAAEAQGVEIEIIAYAERFLDIETDDCDVALLGPQVRFMLPKAKAICEPKNIPVGVIPMQDYGMMNGAKVLAFALSLKI